MNRPPQSPDLNTIEDMWALVEQKLRETPPNPVPGYLGENLIYLSFYVLFI